MPWLSDQLDLQTSPGARHVTSNAGARPGSDPCEVLPELVGGDHNVLPSCVRALALSIVAIGCHGRALICDAFEAQSSALRALQNAIGRPNIPLCDEVAAAIMYAAPHVMP
ncbi:hypothetical protein SAPIO_CDS10361 [Scedosporium apiospermum]|uniref:Uncharacterized protein n=1 Tax=Pseudallescheria apiosperma TaxID=563466 RepID=A0A084FV86_PSEDA|nr:uncharacterized protein SAPIO_CDS10361 [Scedosporium apiospermum]KEZ38998.1 hypothetical protein SAPIO_CDS10361 [Scedosporium apiospermum]